MLEAVNLRKAFGTLVAVDDVSLRLEKGETVGLLGPNGAGKTTTVSMLCGLVTPDRGQVRVDGRPLSGDTNPGKRKIGLVPQDLALYEELSARDNLQFFGALYGLAGPGLEAALTSALELVGLADRARDRVKVLQLLGSKIASGTIIGSLVLLVSFGFAIVVWHVRVDGSVAGFLGVSIASALMAAAYGLLIASLGKTPNAARGASVVATLIMVMLGGAWVPTFIFPAWLQRVTVVVPTRWAVDGFDATTWRGLGVGSAVMPMPVLLGFALAFWGLAVWRFRWEE